MIIHLILTIFACIFAYGLGTICAIVSKRHKEREDALNNNGINTPVFCNTLLEKKHKLERENNE